MDYWGVKSYENDDAGDALDAGFAQVHGELYEELMDDRNALSFEQVQAAPGERGNSGRGDRRAAERSRLDRPAGRLG